MRRIHSNNSLMSQLDSCDMQLDLDSLLEWSNTWLMEFNVEKCAVLHFGYHNPRRPYSLDGSALPVKSCEKDLGVWISDDLKCSVHCAEAVQKAERVVGCIRRAIQNKSIPIVRDLYKSLVRPLLEYCSTVWCPHYSRDIQLIEGVQRRVSKMVPALRHLDYYERLRRLGIQTLETRRYRADLLLMYKMFHGQIAIPVDRLFEVPTHDGLRGHAFKLRCRFTPKRDSARHCFAYRVVEKWNKLPASVVNAPSYVEFKKRLHDSEALPAL